MSPNLPSRTCLSALPLLFLLLLLPGCGGGGSSGSGAGADSGSVPAIPPAPPPPSDNAFSRHREFCAPAPDGTCHHWAPGAVKAEVAYERLATRHPGELPGQGVKVTVIDTGVQLRHWELSQPRTTSEIFTGDGDHHGDEFSHGTAVASLIGAQRDSGSGGFPEADFHGIAYGATMHVAGIRLGAADPDATYRPITPSSLRVEDPGSAALLTQGLRSQGGPDVINMSFQYPGLVEKYTAAELRASSPAALRAVAQAATPERDRALLVYAAGNSNGLPCRGSVDRVGDSCVGETSSERGRLEASSPAVSAGAMALIPELRPHSVAVVAIGRDGRIGDFSNRCGIAARWCIAAPGEDMLVAYWGPGGPDEDQPGYAGYAPGAQGTSFAAPIVSGGLAVVMHYFRGQLGNTEVLARVLGTADVTPDRVAGGRAVSGALGHGRGSLRVRALLDARAGVDEPRSGDPPGGDARHGDAGERGAARADDPSDPGGLGGSLAAARRCGGRGLRRVERALLGPAPVAGPARCRRVLRRPARLRGEGGRSGAPRLAGARLDVVRGPVARTAALRVHRG